MVINTKYCSGISRQSFGAPIVTGHFERFSPCVSKGGILRMQLDEPDVGPLRQWPRKHAHVAPFFGSQTSTGLF